MQDSKNDLKHNWVAGRDADLTQLLHVVEEFFLGLGQNIAGMEHGVDFFQ